MKMEHNTFKKGIKIIIKAFPDKECDVENMWEFLQDLEDAAFIAAISKIVMTTKDINRATNLIALIREFALPENPLAGGAWNEVLKQVAAVGSYGKPTFSESLISTAVDCIGWRTICMSENIGFERAHFLKIFDSLAARKKTETLTESHDIKRLISAVVKRIENKKE